MAIEKHIAHLKISTEQLLPSSEAELHPVMDPEEERVVLSCLRPGGHTFHADDARNELIRRLADRGIGT